jgi:hypothetical protein
MINKEKITKYLWVALIPFSILLIYQKYVIVNDYNALVDKGRIDRLYNDVNEKEKYYFNKYMADQVITSKTGRADGMRLIAVMRSYNCSNCLDQEIKMLNKIEKNKAIATTVYYINDGLSVEEFKRVHKANIQFTEIDTSKIENKLRHEKKSPLLMLVNEKGEIVLPYVPFPDDLKRRDEFYRKIDRIYGTNTFAAD